MGSRRYLPLSKLHDLTHAELKEEWAHRFGAAAPNISPDLLRLGLGHKLQEQRLGRLSRESRSLLRQYAKDRTCEAGATAVPRKLTAGTRLVRDWHGVGHTVIVLEKGFEYDGKTWRSLTAVARAITGTHWNGPRFFGLVEPGR